MSKTRKQLDFMNTWVLKPISEQSWMKKAIHIRFCT